MGAKYCFICLVKWLIVFSLYEYSRCQADDSYDGSPDAEKLFNSVTNSLSDFDPAPFIDILPKRTCDQRSEISSSYTQKYQRFIVEDVCRQDALTPAEKLLIASSFFCYADFYAFMIRLYYDYDQFGMTFRRRLFTDISIIASAYPDMKAWIEEAFDFLNNKDIGYMTKKHQQGDYRSYVRCIWVNEDYTRNFDEPVDQNVAKEIADKMIHEKNKSKWKDDRKELDKALLTHPLNLTKLILEQFKSQYGKDLNDAVRENRDGDLAEAYEWTAEYIMNPIAYTAKRLREAATDIDNGFLLLIQNVLSHAETDIDEVKAAYKSAYQESLDVTLQNSTKGIFKDLILPFIGVNIKTNGTAA